MQASLPRSASRERNANRKHRHPVERLSLAGCASFTFGALTASSHGARRDGSATPLWLAVTPSILIQYRVAAHWHARLELGAQLPLSRAELVVEGEGVLYRTARVAPELALGVEFVF